MISEPIMISALQHYTYCPRRYALLYQESIFTDNVLTQRGQNVHTRPDLPCYTTNNRIRVERALPLWSQRLGLTGKADIVEFHDGIPYPVEYKHGTKKNNSFDDVQLCAQALCLEEMTGKDVPQGAVFYHTSRRRRPVEFTSTLRTTVYNTIAEIRKLLISGITPKAVYDDKCRSCSMIEECIPAITNGESKRNQKLLLSLFSCEEEDVNATS